MAVDFATINDVAPIEIAEPDYAKAFGHLAYIVGQMANASPEERDRLVSEANRIVEQVYNPFIRLSFGDVSQPTPTEPRQG